MAEIRMALIFLGSSTCSICGEILKESDEIVGWAAFLPQGHKLWEYSDSGMHRACFEEWDHKIEFEDLYKYQPLVDLDHPKLKELIENHGTPDWVKEIQEYRKNRK